MDTEMHQAFLNDLFKTYQDYYDALPSHLKKEVSPLSDFYERLEESVIFDDTNPRLYLYEVMLDEYSDVLGNSGLVIADFFIQIATNTTKRAEKIANKEFKKISDVDAFLDELESILDRPLCNLEEFTQDEWSLIELNYHNE